MATEARNLLSRRNWLKAGVAAAAVGVVSLPRSASTLLSGTARASTGVWNHDPASPIGPLHWGDHRIPDLRHGHRPVSGQHQDRPGGRLSRSSAAAEVSAGRAGHREHRARGGGADPGRRRRHAADRRRHVQMVQYHFHAPSEHAVNGRLADLEAHFVHMNAQGVTAVVGVFFTVGPDPNPLLDTILLAAPETAGEEVTAGKSSPAELFRHISGVSTTRGSPVRVNSFYSYTGSLTTPGCTEGVLWSVLADGGQVSGAAVTRFHGLIAQFPNYNGYPNNNRPLQPLNGRVIKLRRGGLHD